MELKKLLKMKIRIIIFVLVFCNLRKAEGFQKPHIVFVLADDLGYNDVGYHNRSDIKTPCIDKLALQGIRLENYYVQPACTPSRSQLMSGRYQIHTGLQHRVIKGTQPNALPLDNIILPQQLKNCGYSTYMVGKWHLGFYKKEFLPWKRGFDRFFGILTGGADYFTRVAKHQGEKGIDFHDETGPVKGYVGNYSTQLYAGKANELIRNHNKTEPMFLYLSHQTVHTPLQGPRKPYYRYKHIRERRRKIKAMMTTALDTSVCDVVEELKRENMWQNTIFIFSTDNGGALRYGGNNWPLRGGKASYFEGGMKGIGFMAGKGISGRKTINKKLFHISDWLPTLMQASHCPIHPGTLPLDGVSQWDALLGNSTSAREEILHNIDPLSRIEKSNEDSETWMNSTTETNSTTGERYFEFDVAVTAAIRNGPWKLITGEPGKGDWQPPQEYNRSRIHSNWKGPVELFNIDSDPFEKVNVASEHPGIVEFLLNRLATYNRTAVPVSYPKIDPKSSPKYHKGYWAPWIF